MQLFSICKFSPERAVLLDKDPSDNSGCTRAVQLDDNDDLVKFVRDDPDMSPVEFEFLRHTISNTKSTKLISYRVGFY